MFKKVNQYLITHYPLLWNLKFIWIVLAALGVNLIAFFNGFFHYHSKNQLLDYNLFGAFFNHNYVLFYFIFSVVILIIWLFFYIKNNRFKSKFPTTRNNLFKEFLGVFFILSLFMCIPNVFKLGLTTHVSHIITDKQFEKEVDLINRAAPFTLQTDDGFSNFSRNLSAPIFDTLVSEQEFLELFYTNKKYFAQKYPEKKFKDILEPYFRNEEFNDLLVKKLKGNFPVNTPSFNYSFNNYLDVQTKDEIEYNSNYGIEAVDAIPYSGYYIPEESANNTILYSLYNYSDIKYQVPNHPEFTQEYYDKALMNILQTNNREKIGELISSYQQLLDKYDVGYQFNANQWINYIPQAPYYFLTHELQEKNYLKDQQYFEKDYINANALYQIYNNIETAKYHSQLVEDGIYYLYAVIVLTILLITFRFTSFKVWLINLISGGILMIFAICFGLGLEVFSIDFYNEFMIAILFYITFIVWVWLGIKHKKNKIITGVCLNFFVASNLVIVLMLLAFYKEIRLDMLYNSMGNTSSLYQIEGNNTEIKFLKNVIDLFLYFNPILYFIGFYFSTNLYRKWQAMPEE